MQIQRAGVPHAGHKSLVPLRKVLSWGDPSLLFVTALGVKFWQECQICSLLPVLMSFILGLGGAVHLVFRSFSEENDTYVTVDLVRTQEEVSPGSSYAAILDLILF